jgi:diguanylate cyclase (GGDEF)-like protein
VSTKGRGMTDMASIEQSDDFWARVRMALGALRPPAREGMPSEGPAAQARQAGVQEELGRSWAMAATRQVSMCLLVIEIDRMSEFFAVYGKDATDRCVRQVMRAIADALPRDGDLCLRMGQATFVVALPDLPLVLARTSAGHITEAIRNLGVAHRESHAGIVTVSMGLAVTNPRGEYDTGFFERAAGALKKAQRKGLGRLQVVDLRPAEERRRRAA